MKPKFHSQRREFACRVSASERKVKRLEANVVVFGAQLLLDTAMAQNESEDLAGTKREGDACRHKTRGRRLQAQNVRETLAGTKREGDACRHKT
jgi:hypothetical protein